jgi:sugar lactone lactonase YvrE
MKNKFFIFSLACAGCALGHPLVTGSLVLKTHIDDVRTQTLVPVYSKTTIDHLTLKLYPLQAGIEQALVASRSIPQTQLDKTIVFSNLRANTTYRIKASAYASTDSSALISTEDANCSTDVYVNTDDRPTLGVLNVRLGNRDFDAEATSSLTFTEGKYNPTGTESLKFMGLEGVVTTFAGTGASGSVDGARLSATFNAPRVLAFDSGGNLFVAEDVGAKIRKITPAGIVTTFAGSGIKASVDNQGTNAAFMTPYGMAFDSSGNLYIGDYTDNRIRKISSSGVVTTVAGNGLATSSDSQGTQAGINGPTGLVFDASGNLYFCEWRGNRIRKMTSGGVLSTIAGNGASGPNDGSGTSATFYGPHCIAIDAHGDLFVADNNNHRIRKVTPSGVVTTFAGSGLAASRDGLGTFACINDPTGLAFDAQGNLYVGERSGNRVRKIAPSGLVTTLAGNGATGSMDGTGFAATLYTPEGIAVNASGSLYVGGWRYHIIRKID